VRGALVIDAQAGVPVATSSAADLEEGTLTALAALATALYGRLDRAASAAECGETGVVRLDGEAGHLLIVSGGDMLVVVMAEADAQLGMLRMEARQVAEGLR
jgi:predicted regulator of Ras-like GTPase activity (Roadblock/LC7/MglB family)